MKKILIFSIAVVVSICSFGQKVTVYETNKEINSTPRKGMAVSLQLDKKFVEKMWKKKLKEFGGKSSNVKGGTEIEGASIPSVAKNPVKIITSVGKGKDGIEVWWAIDMGTSYMEKGGSGWSSAEKIMNDFGKEAYIEDINEQIAEAEKAYEKAQKDYDKEVKEGEDLVKDVEKNGKDKIRLEQEIKDNADQLVQLKKDQEQNKKDQESTKKEAEKMKAAIEVVRKKLDGVK